MDVVSYEHSICTETVRYSTKYCMYQYMHYAYSVSQSVTGKCIAFQLGDPVRPCSPYTLLNMDPSLCFDPKYLATFSFSCSMHTNNKCCRFFNGMYSQGAGKDVARAVLPCTRALPRCVSARPGTRGLPPAAPVRGNSRYRTLGEWSPGSPEDSGSLD